MTNRFKGALFDLDGTLVNNYTAIYNTTAEAFAEAGLSAPNYETIFRTVGGSILITMQKLLAGSGREELAEKLAARYLEIYPRHTFDGLEMMPYADRILAALKERGLKLACFTNKQQKGADEILGKLGLDKYLDAVIATSLHSARKPDREFTEYALKTLSLEAGETVGIGDSPYDYKAARVCGVASALVATGGDPAADLREKCPKALGVYADFKELALGVFDIAL